jgi:hypothetical protein
MRRRTLLVASGVLFLVMGIVMLWSPETFLSKLGLLASTIDARNEARGGYGGMHLAFGIFAIAGAMKAHLRQPALWLVTLLSGGYVLGRVVGVVLEGIPSTIVLGLLAVEAAGAVLGALSLRAAEVER